MIKYILYLETGLALNCNYIICYLLANQDWLDTEEVNALTVLGYGMILYRRDLIDEANS